MIKIGVKLVLLVVYFFFVFFVEVFFGIYRKVVDFYLII